MSSFWQLFVFSLVALGMVASSASSADAAKLPKVYFDITADGKKLGRIVMELAIRCGAQDRRKLPRTVHWRKGLWLQRQSIPSRDS